MVKLYSPDLKCPVFLYTEAERKKLLVANPIEADYLLLPFKYEIIYNFSPGELAEEGLSEFDIPILKKWAEELDKLSVKIRKKLIVFFYRDPDIKLPFQNAVIFRTSLKASEKVDFEFAMPAFISSDFNNSRLTYRIKPLIPRMSFRGQAAPLKLPLVLQIKRKVNRVLNSIGVPFNFKIWFNAGYLARRDAIRAVLKAGKAFKTDFIINPTGVEKDFYNQERFYKSLKESDYFICASGHGNYSYRLYEVMSTGGIPVFIDTDCLLPCADVINWKQVLIWIDQKEVGKTGEIVYEFHKHIPEEDFRLLQAKLKAYWHSFLTEAGFAAYLLDTFLPKLKQNNSTIL